MQKVEGVNLVGLFSPSDGEITQRYGRIGQGKTYGATADVLDDLRRGKIVYINWHMNFHGIDQRDDFLFLIGGLLFPWKKTYYHFPKENLKYIAVDEHFIDNFSKLTDCSVYLDEGHVVFDSYEMAKMNMKKRVAVLHTRHFDRSINIISQRPTAIHVMMRANVNRFYKYQKIIGKPFILFMRTEFQDMTGETVDEDQPLARTFYLGRKKIYNMYDSKYLRNGMEASQSVLFDAYTLNYFDKISFLLGKIFKGAFTRS